MAKNPVTATVDSREFQAALRQVTSTSKRATKDVVNGQALALAHRSLKATKRAQKFAIQATLGHVADTVRRDRKTGNLKAGRRIFGGEGTFAARIINSIRGRRGEPPIFGAEMEKAVRKFINSRVRSIGFIASGWIWSIKDLGRTVRKASDRRGAPAGGGRIAGVTAKGRRKGRGTPAQKGLNPTANIRSESIQSGGAMRVAMSGLQTGMMVSARDMRKHAEKKLQKEFNKVNAR